MSVPIADNKITQECNGVLTDFSFTFKYFSNTDIKVYIVSADGSLDLQTEGADYTLASADKTVGGTVTFGVAPADDEQVLIVREMTLNQATTFKPNTNFPEQVIEAALDKLTMICQQVQEVVNRCVQFPLNSDKTDFYLPEPVAGKSIKWNATLDGFENTDTDIDTLSAELEASVAAAALSESNAATSASTSSAQAGIATTKAAEAAGSAATAASMVPKLGMLNILDFGVIRNDNSSETKTANTTAIQNFFNACLTEGKKGIIPDGTYHWDGLVIIDGGTTASNTTIEGYGRNTKLSPDIGILMLHNFPSLKNVHFIKGDPCLQVGRIVNIASVTRDGNTASVTTVEDHPFQTGDTVRIFGFDQPEYNLNPATITVTGANTYTYTISGTPASPGTTVTNTKAICWDSATKTYGAKIDIDITGATNGVLVQDGNSGDLKVRSQGCTGYGVKFDDQGIDNNGWNIDVKDYGSENGLYIAGHSVGYFSSNDHKIDIVAEGCSKDGLYIGGLRCHVRHNGEACGGDNDTIYADVNIASTAKSNHIVMMSGGSDHIDNATTYLNKVIKHSGGTLIENQVAYINYTSTHFVDATSSGSDIYVSSPATRKVRLTNTSSPASLLNCGLTMFESVPIGTEISLHKANNNQGFYIIPPLGYTIDGSENILFGNYRIENRTIIKTSNTTLISSSFSYSSF